MVLWAVVPARQIGGARPGTLLLQQGVMPAIAAQARHLRVGIVDVAEGNRHGRARALTSGHDITVAKWTIVLVRGDMRCLNTLRTIRALFHHAARAHSHVGIVRCLLRRFRWVAIVIEIEAPHLVRTIARAGSGADAPVIDHLVDAFRTMRRGMNRASHLAWLVLTVHAWHRLKEASRRLVLACLITCDPQPVHLAADLDLSLTDHRHFVLCGASYDAGVAADARIEVDHHAPGSFRWRLCRVKAGLRLHWRQCRLFRTYLAHEVEALHAVMQLRHGQDFGGAGLVQGAFCLPGLIGGP